VNTEEQNRSRYRKLAKTSWKMVGAARFELATPAV